MPTSDPWDGTTWGVTAPDIDQAHGNAYKEIYDLRKGVALRMNKEHVTLATSSAGGEHKQGSAVAWHLATASIPALQPDATALAATDNGRLWHDITTDIFYVLDDYSDPTVDGGWVPMGHYLGDIAINTDKFTVARATGNTLVAGTFEATGASTLTGAVGAAASITLGAGADLIGSSTSDITINTNKFTVAGDTGNTVIAGTLTQQGVATLADTSALATSGAPAADAQIANKKYVDDQKATVDQRCKAWVNFTGRADNGACTVNDSFNVTSVTRTGTGLYTITWDTDFADAHYVWVGSGHKTSSSIFIRGDDAYADGADQTASVAYIVCTTHAGDDSDPGRCRIIAFGNQ